jgi:hypothetical protein
MLIPDFLRRDPVAAQHDRKVVDRLKTEQEEKRKAKSRGRIARLKADKAGERKTMPLSGKDALKKIREEG